MSETTVSCRGLNDIFLPVQPLDEPEPPLYTLPECLLRDIFDLLPLIDQASLALSNKLFHFLFNKALNRREFRFPRYHDYLEQGEQIYMLSSPRNELLLRLEDDRWAYCGGACLKLHPRDKFESPRQLEAPPGIRRCPENAGIIDVCQCTSLTIRDILWMARFLDQGTLPQGWSTSRGENWAKFCVRTDAEGNPFLLHECCLPDNSIARHKLQFLIQLKMDGRQVSFEALYTVQGSRLEKDSLERFLEDISTGFLRDSWDVRATEAPGYHLPCLA
ncbi:uncharacterized protein BDV14DRAFT_200170 [Aspergillus stella-maris]|uniref:uncharacterized protein n=1 Tax=Aspergillus stella-maris TaxID=1810926 RepID=UPI003CCD6393